MAYIHEVCKGSKLCRPVFLRALLRRDYLRPRQGKANQSSPFYLALKGVSNRFFCDKGFQDAARISVQRGLSLEPEFTVVVNRDCIANMTVIGDNVVLLSIDLHSRAKFSSEWTNGFDLKNEFLV
jgi:hypothetical protein